MKSSESILAITKALIAAQSEFKPVTMNAENPYYKSRYADLGAVIESAKPVLKAHGLVVSQLTEGDDGKAGITTLLLHESGEFLSSTIVIPLIGSNLAQEAGKAITYLRRYALASMLGLYTDEDDDGQGLVKEIKKEFPQSVSKTEKVSEISIEEASKLTTEDGTLYGDLPISELAIRFDSMQKMKKNNPDKFTPEHATKMAACKVLIASKRG